MKFVKTETRYKDVTYDPASGKIEGKTNMGFEGPIDCLFSAHPTLLAVSLAMELVPRSVSQLMRLADGYGAPGFFPGGYDWSGFRDSTEDAKDKMFDVATRLLTPHKERLIAMGLPESLVKDITHN